MSREIFYFSEFFNEIYKKCYKNFQQKLKIIYNITIEKLLTIAPPLWYYITKDRETRKPQKTHQKRLISTNESLMKDRIDLRLRQILRELQKTEALSRSSK